MALDYANIIAYVGNDRFFWATDYPHFDHPGNYMEELGRTAVRDRAQ